MLRNLVLSYQPKLYGEFDLKILILSFYYQPDLCAGSFRCTALVKQLQSLAGPNCEIEVITTLPNRYASFSAQAPMFEQEKGLKIQRVILPLHHNGMIDQGKAFIHFAREVNKLIKASDYNLVFATSSRLMTAVLGAWVAKRKNAKLYLDIRDIFVDTINDLLPLKLSFFAKSIFSILEKWSFSKADRINLVSKGFQSYFMQRYSTTKLSWFTNGIDAEFITLKEEPIQCSEQKKILKIVYAGNIGEGQGLHLIIPQLAKRLEGKVIFKIIGDGSRKNRLVTLIENTKCMNIELLAPIDREKIIREYQQADVLFLHLNDYDAFRKVLPSKLFEYAAVGKPIWAGVSGYAAEFIKTEIINAAVFKPCNISEAIDVFATLNLKTAPRAEFIEKYNRDNIMHSMASDILSLV